MVPELVTFAGVAALLTISPGADMALVTRNAMAHGRPAALRTTVGISTGLLAWAVASAMGVAALLATSATAFTVVKIAGAVYLVWLGITTFRGRAPSGSSDSRGPDSPAVGSRGGISGRMAFRQGLLTNLLNPKIALFYSTVLPQFISPGDPALAMSLALALVHVCLTLAWLSAYALVLTRAGAMLRAPRLKRALERVTGLALVGLGVRLAAAGR